MQYLLTVWQKRGLAPRTGVASALRGYYAYLCAEHVREDNPASYLSSPKMGKALPASLSEEQVIQLLQGAEQLQPLEDALMMSAGLELLYATGMRISELLSLREVLFYKKIKANDYW